MKLARDKRYPNRPYVPWQRKRAMKQEISAGNILKSSSKAEKAKKIEIAKKALKELGME